MIFQTSLLLNDTGGKTKVAGGVHTLLLTYGEELEGLGFMGFSSTVKGVKMLRNFD